MNTIRIILLVAFVIICIFLILLVLLQDDGSSGMGGLLGGRGTAAFGSHSATVLTKSTTVLALLFFAVAFSLSLVNKKPKIAEKLDNLPIQEQAGESVLESGESAEKSKWWNQTSENDSAESVSSESNIFENSMQENNTENAFSEANTQKNDTAGSSNVEAEISGDSSVSKE